MRCMVKCCEQALSLCFDVSPELNERDGRVSFLMDCSGEKGSTVLDTYASLEWGTSLNKLHCDARKAQLSSEMQRRCASNRVSNCCIRPKPVVLGQWVCAWAAYGGY